MAKFNAARGGRGPSSLREAFEEYVEEHESIAKSDSIEVGFEDTPRPITWLVGQLWNCTDIMPASLCSSLDLRQGSTYAMGVRRLAEELEEPGGPGGR
jgi:hypothetical protein